MFPSSVNKIEQVDNWQQEEKKEKGRSFLLPSLLPLYVVSYTSDESNKCSFCTVP